MSRVVKVAWKQRDARLGSQITVFINDDGVENDDYFLLSGKSGM